LLVGDFDGKFRIWKYDTHKAAAFRRFGQIQALMKKQTQTLTTFRYKTRGFCKREKKRTGCCGLCFGMKKIEYKNNHGQELLPHEKVDCPLLKRHKVLYFHIT
jgi:hypothetical protein